jgi:hypothetical protein
MLKNTHLSLIFITGILCVNAPAAARFVSADPVSAQQHIEKGNIQGFNRYTYVNKGIAGDTTTQAGRDKSENGAMKMGNIYRQANKEPLRKEY